ncbi:serine/threonine-protein kinase [Streptomyces sp. NPDC093109]|uniref:serine/threonine-protein kinase n=1 Tax=Streptomyces sp. NPDC093109 TaxID=3154977 RepID=UPI0034506D6F
MLAGRYRLGESIGSGGMGRVWRAHDEVLHRVVAIKELTAGRYASEADRAVLHQRTQNEARAAARITHPAVVTVHDVLEHDGRPWIVMQYVDGPSLADVARDSGPVDYREAARIGLAVLGALRAAHTAGVLHRDVKPGNVLLARDGSVLLTDFGIAAIEGDATITRTGEIVGSIDYLAPERIRGADPGPASDLWSLGATLHTALCGSSPFRRESALATMQAVVTDEPEKPWSAGPLAPVIAALLRKDPDARPGTAECERMLREVVEGRSPAGPEPYDTTRPVRYDGARTATVSATALSAAGAVVGAGGSGTARSAGSASGPEPAPGGSGTAPSVAPSAARPAGRRRGRLRAAAVAVVVAAVLGGGGGFVALKYLDGSGGPSTGSGGTAAPDDATNPDDADAWTQVEAPEGFSLKVPKGWERKTDSEQIDFTPDNGVHLIRIGISAPDFEDPYTHMVNLEKQLQRLPDYRRISMAPNSFRDKARSARWEFTWTENTATAFARHAVDQIYYSDDGNTEYAIYMSGPEEDWATTHEQFDVVLRSWQPPPADGSG